ncbi:MAG: L,D-transpeptidase [Lachnospiraceae bacterium]|nr:L,D-transpeptidase [Lachnospiraceae bacterium]
MSSENVTKGTKKSRLKGVLIGSLIAAVLILAGAYLWEASRYRELFLPGTIIGDVNASGMTPAQVTRILDAEGEAYEMDVYGRDRDGIVTFLGSVGAKDIGLTYVDTLDQTTQVLSGQNIYLWPLYRLGFRDHFARITPNYVFSREDLVKTVMSWDVFHIDNMSYPENARISDFDPATERYSIVDATVGNSVNKQKLRAILREVPVSGAGRDELRLEETDVYVEPAVTAENAKLQGYLETANRWVSTNLVYEWNKEDVRIGAKQVSEWITFSENSRPQLEEAAVAEFVAQEAEKNNTFGSKRDFTTTEGETIQVPGNGYGWRTNRDETTAQLLSDIREGKTGISEPVFTYRAYAKGKSDIGDSYVEIDLTAQHVYLYVDGEIVVESDCVSGKVSNGNTTPGGLYGITYKTKDTYLRGEGYVSHVNYWMPFNGNIGMHDATWRGSFGGKIFLTSGSHGCVNLPLKRAAEIYEYVEKGFPVVCYYTETPVAPVAPPPEIPDETDETQTAPAPEGEAAPAPEPAPEPAPTT